MLVSFVLRLRHDALRGGVVAGEVEDVETGTRTTLRSVDDLVAVVTATAEHPTPALSSRAEEAS